MNRRTLLGAGFSAAVMIPELGNDAIASAEELTATAQAYPLTGEVLNSTNLTETQAVLIDRFSALPDVKATISVTTEGVITVEAAGDAIDQEAMTTLLQRNFVEIIDPIGEYLEDGLMVTTSLGGPPWSPPMATPAASPAASVVYQTIVSSYEITKAYPSVNQLGQMIVGFELSAEGAQALAQYSAANLGKPMSITIDNEVVLTATLNGVISKEGIIEGQATETESRALAASLNARPLPVHLTIVNLD